MVQMNFIFISSSDINLLRKKSVKQKIKKLWPKLGLKARSLGLNTLGTARHSRSLSAVCPGNSSWDLGIKSQRKTGEARDRTHDPGFTRRVALPLHHGGFFIKG